jgi:uncharacterized protein YuzE
MVAVGRRGSHLAMVPYHDSYHSPSTAPCAPVQRETRHTMNKPKMFYFDQEDILHLVIAEEEEASSVELSLNVTAELNEKGELIGIEILHASTFVRDPLLEGVQARLLHLTSPDK